MYHIKGGPLCVLTLSNVWTKTDNMAGYLNANFVHQTYCHEILLMALVLIHTCLVRLLPPDFRHLICSSLPSNNFEIVSQIFTKCTHQTPTTHNILLLALEFIFGSMRIFNLGPWFVGDII